nr:glycerophosphodiester phosphodiesterase family protein [Fredinandcohnia onubensis]
MKIFGIAHRGYPVKEPENTIASFEEACKLSFSHLEFDVHLSKDGVPVIMHDYSIERMTDGKGLIKDYTVEELKQFKIGGTESIPTLEETLERLKGRISFIIELKQAGDYYPGLEKAVLEVVDKTGTEEQSMIISIDHFSLKKVREFNETIALGALIGGNAPYVIPFLKEINATFLGLHYRFLTDEYATMLSENNIIINPGVVDAEEDMKLMVEKYPASLVTTNELERWGSIYKVSQ